jgi:hypothetical protein
MPIGAHLWVKLEVSFEKLWLKDFMKSLLISQPFFTSYHYIDFLEVGERTKNFFQDNFADKTSGSCNKNHLVLIEFLNLHILFTNNFKN